jgi:multiple sugar transport system substrate-binding protein
VEEQLVALPIGTYPAVLAYDRDLFDEAGLPYPPASYGARYAGGGAWTIANLAETARQLTVDAAGSSAADADFDPLAIERWGFQGTTDDLATALGLFGAGSFVDGRGRAAISPNWREAIHWYRDAVCEDHTHLSAAAHAVWGTWPFRSGVVGMAYGPLWIVNQLGTEQNWDLAAVPAHDGMAGPSLDAGIAVGVLGTAVHAEEAFEVANAIASNPELAAAWGAYPARASVQGPFLDEMAARYPGVRWEVVVDGVERGELVDGAMPSVEAWSYGEELLARIESGEICAADVDAEIERLEAGLAASLSE